MYARARKRQKRAQLFISVRMRMLGDYVRVRARNIKKIKILFDMYIDSLSFKFYEDPFTGCGEIAETKLSMHIYHFQDSCSKNRSLLLIVCMFGTVFRKVCTPLSI